MAEVSARKRIWGWFFFDWASQPYNTLLITFIFAPYVKELMGDGAQAQAAWGFGIGLAGIVIALLAPVLGALSDSSTITGELCGRAFYAREPLRVVGRKRLHDAAALGGQRTEPALVKGREQVLDLAALGADAG